MSQNRYQFPGEKNCCQRGTKDQQTDETNEDNQEKDEERFTKTGTNHYESPRELERQSEAQRMLAPQSEANVCRHKCNRKKSRPLKAQDTQQKLGIAFSYLERKNKIHWVINNWYSINIKIVTVFCLGLCYLKFVCLLAMLAFMF